MESDRETCRDKVRWHVVLLCLLPAGLYAFSGLPHSGAPLLLSVMLFLNLWVLTLYDLASFRLPNLLTATLGLGGLVYVWLLPSGEAVGHLVGGLVGLVFFPTINVVYRRVRGRDGVGLGDAKLLAGIGLWLGWQALPPVLLLGSFAGLVFGVALAMMRKMPIMTLRIPFGPFLCLGAWVGWLFLVPHLYE